MNKFYVLNMCSVSEGGGDVLPAELFGSKEAAEARVDYYRNNDPNWGCVDWEIHEEVVQQMWQPIETAPKDGTRILIYHEQEGVHLVCWEQVSEKDRSYGWQDGWFDIGTFPYTASHWMPLPVFGEHV